MQLDSRITDVAHVIQLAVAPVFLLSGVGVTLTVLTNRLAFPYQGGVNKTLLQGFCGEQKVSLR